MSEPAEQQAPEKEPATPKHPNDVYETAYHLFDGQVVKVQLFEPYIAEMTEEGPLGSTMLVGSLRVMRGDQGTLHLVLQMQKRATNGSLQQLIVTLHPNDVKHLTLTEESLIQGA